MKKNYNTQNYLKLLGAVFALSWAGAASAQLSGSYTIDSTSATGGTNFKSWFDFQVALDTSGVNGAVTVEVLTDQADAQVAFQAVSGASSSNTITINGNGKVLQSTVSDAVILMDGADYFTFNNLVIRNAMNSSHAQGMRFMNNADHNTVKNCTIEFSALTVKSTSGAAYIAFSTSATSRTTSSSTNHGAYNTFDKNLMRTTNTNSPGPTFGIAIQGSSSSYTSTAQNNTISNNTIQNFYYYAIRNYYSNGNQIVNNDISRANATSNNCNSTLYGIYSYYSYAANRPTLIDGNTLHDWPYSGSSVSSAPSTVYAFYTYDNYGNSSYRFSISNNTVKDLNAGTNMYLGYNYYNYYFDLMNNMADNVDVTASTSSSYNFYGWYNGYTYNSYRFNGNTIKNCDGGYYWYGIRNYYPQTPNDVQEINDNVIRDNKKSYYYTYRIYSYYAQYSSKTYPISISRNTIKNNSHDYYYTYNIYTYYYGTYDIMDNVIDSNKSGYYYMYDIYSYYYGNYNIRRNKITANDNTAGKAGYHYGIYNYYNYNVNITDNLISENIGYYYTYGIYAYSYQNGGYKANIRQNTVRIDAKKSGYSSHYSYGLYCNMYYFASTTVDGNIVDISGNYGAYPAYSNGTNIANIHWNRNLYYVNNVSVQNWYSAGSTLNSFSAWTAGSIAGPDEEYGDPKWNDPSIHDLRSNSLIGQNDIPFNPLNATDANGVLRNTTKNDKGALENMLDIAQTANNFSPNPQECSGFTVSPTITLKNNFLDAVTGFYMGVAANGKLMATQKVTSSIAVNGTGTVTFDPIKFSQSGNQVVQFFLLDADDKPVNDTFTFTFLIKKAPGGGDLTLDSARSAIKARYDITGKPDVTTNGQPIVYDLSPPATVGYTNADHILNGGSKWRAVVNASTDWGVSVPGASVSPPVGASDAYVTFTPTLGFVDSLVNVCVTVSDYVSGCDTTYCRKVLVAPQGVPDFKLPAILCDKDEVLFENISTVTSGNLLSTWDFGDGSPTSDATNPVYTYSTPGTYNIKLTVVTVPYGYATSITKTVTVNEIPATNFKITNACEGSPIKLTNTTTIGTGTLTYEWDLGDGSPVSTSVNISKQYAAAGGYKVTLTAKGNGCASVLSRNVYQFARPLASFSRATGVCQNDEFTFNNTSSISTGQVGNSWDFDDAGNRATLREPVYHFVTPGTKNVKLKVISEFGCTDSLIRPIEVKAVPTSGFTAPFACSRTATQFTNTTNLHGEVLGSYNWNFGDGYTSTSFAPSHSWTTIGPRTVKLKTILANGCSDEASQVLNVGVQPEVNFQFSDQCAGSEVHFINSTIYSQGEIMYEWNFGDQVTSDIASPTHTYLTGGGTQTYIVKLKAGIVGGCEDSALKVININALPTTCDFNIDRDYLTSATAYKMTPVGGDLKDIHYTWLTGDGNSVTSVASGTSYSYKLTGRYCITMIASNPANCECSAVKCVTLTTDIRDEKDLQRAISIYPNPNSGVFQLLLDGQVQSGATVNVYNPIGELVRTISITDNASTIDLSGYAPGVYILRISVGGLTTMKKVTIDR